MFTVCRVVRRIESVEGPAAYRDRSLVVVLAVQDEVLVLAADLEGPVCDLGRASVARVDRADLRCDASAFHRQFAAPVGRPDADVSAVDDGSGLVFTAVLDCQLPGPYARSQHDRRCRLSGLKGDGLSVQIQYHVLFVYRHSAVLKAVQQFVRSRIAQRQRRGIALRSVRCRVFHVRRSFIFAGIIYRS